MFFTRLYYDLSENPTSVKKVQIPQAEGAMLWYHSNMKSATANGNESMTWSLGERRAGRQRLTVPRSMPCCSLPAAELTWLIFRNGMSLKLFTSVLASGVTIDRFSPFSSLWTPILTMKASASTAPHISKVGEENKAYKCRKWPVYQLEPGWEDHENPHSRRRFGKSHLFSAHRRTWAWRFNYNWAAFRRVYGRQ